MMEINPYYRIGDIVYLKNDIEQLPLQVIAYEVYAEDKFYIKTLATRGLDSDYHTFLEFQLSQKKDDSIKVLNE